MVSMYCIRQLTTLAVLAVLNPLYVGPREVAVAPTLKCCFVCVIVPGTTVPYFLPPRFAVRIIAAHANTPPPPPNKKKFVPRPARLPYRRDCSIARARAGPG